MAQRYRQRTPALAAGRTNRRWTAREVLASPLLPACASAPPKPEVGALSWCLLGCEEVARSSPMAFIQAEVACPQCLRANKPARSIFAEGHRFLHHIPSEHHQKALQRDRETKRLSSSPLLCYTLVTITGSSSRYSVFMIVEVHHVTGRTTA